MTTYYGKYRGRVVNNTDPLMMGRLTVFVPDVSDFPLGWAMPCVPYAGKNVGFFAVPPISANVWVEFEGGDLSFPIWTGCFWGEGEMPVKQALPNTKVIQTETVTFEIDDSLTSVSLEWNGKAKPPFANDDGTRGMVELIHEKWRKVIFDDDGFAMQDEKGNVVKVDSNSGAMTVEAKGQLNIKAASITIEATGTLELKANATLTIRGSLVNIN